VSDRNHTPPQGGKRCRKNVKKKKKTPEDKRTLKIGADGRRKKIQTHQKKTGGGVKKEKENLPATEPKWASYQDWGTGTDGSRVLGVMTDLLERSPIKAAAEKEGGERKM